MTAMKKQESYEAMLARLQSVVERLEEPGVTLEESMKLFEEGVGLVKQCGDALNAAQQKIDLLAKSLEKTPDGLE